MLTELKKREASIIDRFENILIDLWSRNRSWEIKNSVPIGLIDLHEDWVIGSDSAFSFTEMRLGCGFDLDRVDGEFRGKWESALKGAMDEFNLSVDVDDDDELLFMDERFVSYGFAFSYFASTKNFLLQMWVDFDGECLQRKIYFSDSYGLDGVIDNFVDEVSEFFGGGRRNYVYVQIPAKKGRMIARLYKLDKNECSFLGDVLYNPASTRGVKSEIWTYLTGKEGFFYNGVDNICLTEIYNK